MAEGGVDEYELEDFDINDFERYTDEDLTQQLTEIDSFISGIDGKYPDSTSTPNKVRVEYDDISRRRDEIITELSIRRGRTEETSFIDTDDGKTVTIRGFDTEIPPVQFASLNEYKVGDISFDLAFKDANGIKERLDKLNELDKKTVENGIKRIKRVDEKIRKLYKKKLGHNKVSREIVNRTNISTSGSVFFTPINNIVNEYWRPKLILKPDGKNGLVYSKDAKSKNSIEQFKKLVNQLSDIVKEDETDQFKQLVYQTDTTDDFPVVDTRVNYDDVLGLTPNENRELSGVLNPSDRVLSESRVGDSGALQIQADNFQDTLNETMEMIEELDRKDEREGLTPEEDEEQVSLYERAVGLERARDRTLDQRKLEEVREQQEVDISRYERFKEWAKENMVGLSAVAIAVAGIITSIVVAGRSAIITGAGAVKSFAQVVKSAIAKLGPWAVGLANFVYTVLSAGAKGLAWLAQNLWVLAVVLTWFVYDYYTKKKRQ